METCRIDERRVGLCLPVYVVEEFCSDVAVRTEIALVCAVEGPPVVVDFGESGEGGAEEGDTGGVPGGVVVEVGGQGGVEGLGEGGLEER